MNICSHFLHFLSGWMKLWTGDVHRNLLCVCVSFMKTCAVKASLYLQAILTLYSFFSVCCPILVKSMYICVNNEQDALYRLIYYSKSTLHVSGDVFAHHWEHLTVFTVSGSVHPSCCQLPASISVLTMEITNKVHYID